MKKIFAGLLVAALIISAFPVSVLAEDLPSDFDNWKAIFFPRNRTFEDFNYREASAKIILNYVKGKGGYIVSVNAAGLKPGKEYELVFTKGEGGNRIPKTICWFTADAVGKANFTIQGWEIDSEGMDWIEPTSPMSYFNIRIHMGTNIRWVLTTYPTLTENPLESVGSNRGE